MPSSEKRPSKADDLRVRPLSSADKPVRRAFPGPRGAEAPLRVAIDRVAYADLVAHAKASLDAEVCGVLVGQIGEDETGVFVHVEALIRGNAAAQGATHVTFTQATWDAIHQSLERDHPKCRIVGWYHTHPGFGVVFSDMDLFIQRNFFPGPTQIALVTDPMSGAVAIAINSGTDIGYLSRFWVDGREMPGQVPASGAGVGEAASMARSDGSSAPASPDGMRALEARISQLIQANDEQRILFHRMVLTIGLVFCLGIIAVVAYVIREQYSARIEPPRINGYVPIPVQVGDKTVLLGVGLLQWDVPPELNALLIEQDRRDREAAREAAEAKRQSEEPAKDDAADASAPVSVSTPSIQPDLAGPTPAAEGLPAPVSPDASMPPPETSTPDTSP